MIHWLVLLSLLAAEFFLALLLIKLLALLPSWWVRWPAWSVLAAIAIAAAAGGLSAPYAAHWALKDRETPIYSPELPFATARMYLIGVALGLPAFFVVAGLVGLFCRSKDEPVPRARRWPAVRVWSGLGFSLLLFLLAFLVTDWLICQKIRAIEARSKEVAASAAPPACAEAENAALLIAASMPGEAPLKLLGDLPDDIRQLKEPKWTDFLAEHRQLARTVREAAERPCWRFQIDWSNASMIADTPDDTFHAMYCARLLTAEGHAALLVGNADLAYANAIALRRLADHLSHDPRVVVQLSSFASNGMATALIEHALLVRSPTTEEHTALVARTFEFKERFAKSLTWTEAELYDAVAEMYVRQSSDDTLDPPPGHGLVLAVNLAFSRVLYAEDDIYALPRAVARLRKYTSVTYADGVARDFSHAPTTYELVESGGLVTEKLLLMQYAVISNSFRADAERRIADAGLFLSGHSKWESATPAEIAKIVAELQFPIDPFTAQPLKVIAADGGVVIYSVGMNLTDEGGVEQRKNALEGDYPFCLGEAFRNRHFAAPMDEPATESN